MRFSSLRFWSSTAALAACIVSSGCGDGNSEPAEPEAAKPAEAAVETALAGAGAAPGGSVPFDIGSVVRRVHFAYRPVDGGFEGGHRTYSVRVKHDGAFEVRPHRLAESTGSQSTDADRSALEIEHGAPGVFETAGVQRGTARLAGTVSAVDVREDGSLAIDRGAAIEVLRNTATGAEQRWEIASKPAGDGPLIARVSVSGVVFAGSTDSGLHFTDPRSGLGLRYGHGTWIDGNGAETHVPVRFADGHAVLTVPAEVVEASAFPAVLDPEIGPEFAIDVPVSMPAATDQARPEVEFDGTNHFVIWTDTRPGDNGLYGARVAPDGTVIDPSGLLLHTSAGSIYDYKLSLMNGVHLLVWRSGSDIYAKRVDVDGTPLGPHFAVIASGFTETSPDVANDGTNWFVVWEDHRDEAETNANIYGARVSAAGTVLDSGGVAICTNEWDQLAPRVDSNGSGYFVAWEDARNTYSYEQDIYGVWLDATGAVVSASDLQLGHDEETEDDVAVTCAASDCAVAWRCDYALHGAIVAPGDVVTAMSISPYMGSTSYHSTSLATDGTGFLLVSGEGSADVAAQFVGADGVSSGTKVFIEDTSGYYPRVAYDGTSYLVAWLDNRNDESGFGSMDIYGNRLDGDANVLHTEDIRIASTHNDQYHPDVAYDGTDGFLVVWQDERYMYGYTTKKTNIMATRVSDEGTVLDPTGIEVTGGETYMSKPRVAFGGGVYLVVWDKSLDVKGRRVGEDGTLLDSVPFTISDDHNAETPDVAFDGTNFFIVFQDWYDNGISEYYKIKGRQMTPGKVFLDASFSINSYYDTYTPAVGFNGSHYLVVWSSRYWSSDYGIHSARVSTGAYVYDRVEVNSGYYSPRDPDVTADGTNFLVVWNELHSTGSVSGALMDPLGDKITSGKIGISDNTSLSYGPSRASFDGLDYVVAWGAKSGSTAYVRGGIVNVDGTVSERFDLVADADPSQMPTVAVASTPSQQTLFVYSEYVADDDVEAQRLFGRFIGDWELADGLPCASDANCANDQCEDGVCCATDCGDSNPDDCRACSTDGGASGNGTCETLGTSHVCRDSAGDCDVAESCDGIATDCPTDLFEPDTTECHGAVGDCDVSEYCTGSSAGCPADAFAGAGTPCGSSADTICDDPDTCDGAGTCLPNHEPTTTVCNPATEDCDVAEYCDGSGGCPADAFAPSTQLCRVADEDCDVPEYCTGSSALCPTDAFEPSTTICRTGSGDCDPAEYCTGSSALCPADAFADVGTPCGSTADTTCDNPDTCDGAGDCLSNYEPTSTVCNPVAGVCDIAEYCDGAGGCPADVFEPTSTQCDTQACSPDACEGSTAWHDYPAECEIYCDGTADCPTSCTCTPTDADCTAGGCCEPACADSTGCFTTAGSCTGTDTCETTLLTIGSVCEGCGDADATGTCGSGAALECSDTTHTECETASCDGTTYYCSFLEDTWQWRDAADCDDGDLCTYGDVCGGEGCAGTPITCDDANCLDRECNGTNACDETILEDGEECDDGDPFTYDDHCESGGVCVGTTDTDTGTDTDTETDTDTGTDGDTDTDTDTDSDTDADSDTDTDTDGDSDADTDSDTDTDADGDCTGDASQCVGDMVQICEEGNWIDWTDCAAQGMTCALVQGEAQCVGGEGGKGDDSCGCSHVGAGRSGLLALLLGYLFQ